MRKITAILMALCLFLSFGIFTAGADEKETLNYWICDSPDIDPSNIPGDIIGKLGDSDNNSIVNIKDATAIQKHVAEISKIDNSILILADADLSGEITVKDATAIQKYLAGMLGSTMIGNIIYTTYDVDKDIVGNWELTVNSPELINEMLPYFTQDPMFTQYVQAEEFIVKEVYTFREDGTYLITLDYTVLNDSIAKLKIDLESDMSNYLEAFAEQKGYYLTAEEMLEIMEYGSMAEFIDDVLPLEEFLTAIKPTEGYYRTWQGRLYMDDFYEDFYEFYNVDGNTLTITGNSEGTYPEEYPLTFTKIKPM